VATTESLARSSGVVGRKRLKMTIKASEKKEGHHEVEVGSSSLDVTTNRSSQDVNVMIDDLCLAN